MNERPATSLTRGDWYLLGGLVVFAFFLRFFSPIYPDFLTHPASWPPVHLSSPAWPVQAGHFDASTKTSSPQHGEVFDEIYFGDFAHNDIVGTPYFDPEPPVAKHLIAVGEIATGTVRLIASGHSPFGASMTQIADLGFNTFGYRIMSVIFGTLLVAGIFLLAHRLWPNRFFAGAAGFLASIDGMLFVQSRIGMIDVFAVTFIVFAYFAFFWHLRARTPRSSLLSLGALGGLLGLAISSKWIALAALATMLLILLVRHWPSALFGGSILALIVAVLGLAVGTSTGLIALLSIAGLLAALVAVLAQATPLGLGWTRVDRSSGAWLRLGSPGAETSAAVLGAADDEAPPADSDPFAGNAAVTGPAPTPGGFSPLTYGALLGLFLGLLPALMYIASFWRWVGMHPCPGDPCGWHGLVGLHHQIWDYHSGLRATHPYGSPWYTWPLLLRPVAYYFESQNLGIDMTSLPILGNPNRGQNLVAGIINLGNPVIWWAADIALLVTGLWAARRRALVPAFIVLAFLTAWLPWMPVSRVLFMYHMFGGVPYMILALAYVLARLHQLDLRVGNPRRHLTIRGADLAYGFLALALLAFLFWYPVWTALPISDSGYLGPFPGGKMWLQGPSGGGGGYSWTLGWI